MTSPYAVLVEALPGVRLAFTADERVLDGARARWFPDDRVIVVDSRVRRLKSRCSVAHEIGHIVLGHEGGCGDDANPYDYRNELAADEFAARLLLDDLTELIVQLATTSNHGHAASNLNVTLDIFEARLGCLDPGEAAMVDEIVREIQEGVGC